MKTVLHVIEQLSDFGGTPRKLLYLSANNNYLVNRLIFITYMDSSLYDAFEKNGACVVKLKTMSVWKMVWEIVRIARENNADVLCSHYTRPLLACYLASRITGLPLIHNEHSSAHYRTGKARVLAKICMPHASAVVCNSTYTANTISDTYHINPSRIHVLYNPVEARSKNVDRELMRNSAGLAENAIVIGHVGGMIETRDHKTLIKAFRIIHELYPQARLMMIGDGPLKNSLMDLANDIGLSQAVNFLGYTNDIGNYLSAMDVYVNPTIDEGFGIAVVEAMLSGLPVVLANAGAHPELIDDGVDGILYPPSNINGLVNALVKLINNLDFREKISMAGRSRAALRFAPGIYTDGYEGIIDAVTLDNQGNIFSGNGG